MSARARARVGVCVGGCVLGTRTLHVDHAAPDSQHFKSEDNLVLAVATFAS